jgi:hypothetical protein
VNWPVMVAFPQEDREHAAHVLAREVFKELRALFIKVEDDRRRIRECAAARSAEL